MKRKGLYTLSILLFTAGLSLSGCSASKTLYKAASTKSLSSDERSKVKDLSLMEGLLDFSYKYTVAPSYNEEVNFVVSPISIYMCLAELSECTSGESQMEILNALGVSSVDELREGISLLYNSLIRSKSASSSSTKPKTIMSELLLTNSIWLNTDLPGYNKDVLKTLSEEYYTSSFNVDFYRDNSKANKKLSKYVSKSTNELINYDFNYNIYTMMVLLNTIYYKDSWDGYGSSLSYRSGYSFTSGTGISKETRLYTADYEKGQPLDRETYTSFFTTTYGGYTLYFILPKDGYTLSDIYKAETVKDVLSASEEDYVPLIETYDEKTDTVTRTHYETRCLFPEFSATTHVNPISLLSKEEFGISKVFNEYEADMSALYPYAAYPIFVDEIDQITTLSVTRKGIEASSVSAVKSKGDIMSAQTVYIEEQVFLDYPVDRAFMYVITSPNDIPLFTGYINNV
ncbi:MAG: hypothetical protein LUB56_02880 [Coprobacillus sp.]|nr:hypothetical protein [Coprobacillus sp.]